MSPEERTVADYAGTGVTVGRHPVAHCRAQVRDSVECVRLVWEETERRIAEEDS